MKPTVTVSTSTIATRRLDSAITPSSYVRAAAYSTFAGIFIILAWWADLLLWQYTLLLIVSGVAISYLALSKPILLHLSQPPLDLRLDEGWQILMRTAYGDQLWQASLISAQRHTLLVHLRFEVREPSQRPLSLTVFRDQVSREDWRRLNILAAVR